ncbi:hypothetical protein [Rhizobium leguminosarum]|uniref:hypothetical protein n=1 Tax=Rhizobium leguminosarum TaxID=384 RepID=UPI001C98368C|nr:hypothetical protein [Rhizobium leguminosarum]MBY5370465.1 hypothetical protein [Rhizobium leguminosarum]
MLAGSIAARLKAGHGIESDRELIARQIDKSGEDLAFHLKNKMAKRTQLLAVISEKTPVVLVGALGNWGWLRKKLSACHFLWWQYLASRVSWKVAIPRTQTDLDADANASKHAERTLVRKRATLNEGTGRSDSTGVGYLILRKSLICHRHDGQ